MKVLFRRFMSIQANRMSRVFQNAALSFIEGRGVLHKISIWPGIHVFWELYQNSKIISQICHTRMTLSGIH